MQIMTFSPVLEHSFPVCASVDTTLAGFFHGQTSGTFHSVMEALSAPGSGVGLASVLVGLIVVLAVRRHWFALLAVMLTVPGMCFGELIKVIVQRQRPFPGIETGYSFPSGHTISVTLLYGTLALLLFPLLTRKRWRALIGGGAALLILLVGFSRIALTAHYLTDVMAAMGLGTLWIVMSYKVTHTLKRRVRTADVEVSSPES